MAETNPEHNSRPTSQMHKVIIRGPSVYLSVHGQPLPPDMIYKEEIDNPWDVHKQMWISDRNFYAVFTPSRISYAGGMFDVLDLPKAHAPIEEYTIETKAGYSARRFRLGSAALHRYETLEDVVLRVTRACQAAGLPLYITLPVRTPSSCGYKGSYDNRKRMLGAIMNTKAAFTMYLAFISSMRFLAKWDADIRPYIDPEALDYLDHTWYSNAEIPRVGGLVNARRQDGYQASPQWMDMYWEKLLALKNVPVWIHYGSQPPLEFSHRLLRDLMPSASDANRALLEAQLLPDTPTLVGAPPPSSSTFSGFPGRSPGEIRETEMHPRDWLASMEQARAAALVSESPAARAIRTEREKIAASEEVPNRRGGLVFIWEAVGPLECPESLWSRKVVGKKNLRSVWSTSSSTMRVFHSHINQWDIWEGLDPTYVPENDLEEFLDSHTRSEEFTRMYYDDAMEQARSPSHGHHPSPHRSPIDDDDRRRSRSISPRRLRHSQFFPQSAGGDRPRYYEPPPPPPRHYRRSHSPAPRDRRRSPSPPPRHRRRSPSPLPRHRRRSPSPSPRYRRRPLSPPPRHRRSHSPAPRDRRRSPSPPPRHRRPSRSPPRHRRVSQTPPPSRFRSRSVSSSGRHGIPSPPAFPRRRRRSRSQLQSRLPYRSRSPRCLSPRRPSHSRSSPVPQNMSQPGSGSPDGHASPFSPTQPDGSANAADDRMSWDAAQEVKSQQGQVDNLDDMTIHVPPVSDVLIDRYGFIPATEYELSDDGVEVPFKHDALGRIWGAAFSGGPIPRPWEDCLFAFTRFLWLRQSPPAMICDLTSNATQRSALVRAVPYVRLELNVNGVGIVQGEDKVRGYLLGDSDPRSPQALPWLLVVEEPLTVCQALRSNWPSNKLQLLHQLVQRGIPFRQILPSSQESLVRSVPLPLTPSGKPFCLGEREWKHVFSLHDYKLYVATRDRLCESFPHVRAGLTMGGIVWRLCIEAIKEDVLFEGPAATGAHRRRLEYGGASYSEDVLSEDDENTICGVFKVKNQDIDDARSHAHVSWWPKPNVWKASGMDWGHWTPRNETWYQERVTSIRNGKATPMNSRKWKDFLKGSRIQMNRIMGKVTQLSAASLE